MRSVRVIGGGASGLVTAYYLKRQGFEVEVFEASDRLGGLIATQSHPFGLVETAANGLINSATVEDLFADLGVKLAERRPERKKRYIYRSRPRRWPLSVSGSASFVSHLAPKVLNRTKLQPHSNETIAEWGQRCLGKEGLEYLLAPALTGVYAGDPKKMSASLILGDLFAPKDKSQTSSRELQQKGTVAPAGGMGQLIEALAQWLEKNGVQIHLETPMTLESEHPEIIEVVATNLHTAGRLLKEAGIPWGQKLLDCEMIPLISTTMFLEPESLSFGGFGCLFPQQEGFNSLGTLFNHCIFSGRTEVASQTWIMGGALKPEIMEWSDADVISAIVDDHRRLHGRRPQVLGQKVTRWPKAIPHYDVNLDQTVREAELPDSVYLSGNYMGRIGLAKIIERAKKLAEDLNRRYQS